MANSTMSSFTKTQILIIVLILEVLSAGSRLIDNTQHAYAQCLHLVMIVLEGYCNTMSAFGEWWQHPTAAAALLPFQYLWIAAIAALCHAWASPRPARLSMGEVINNTVKELPGTATTTLSGERKQIEFDNIDSAAQSANKNNEPMGYNPVHGEQRIYELRNAARVMLQERGLQSPLLQKVHTVQSSTRPFPHTRPFSQVVDSIDLRKEQRTPSFSQVADSIDLRMEQQRSQSTVVGIKAQRRYLRSRIRD